MKTVCCVCQRTKSRDGWVKKRVECSSKMSHGYCPECYDLTMQKVYGNPFWNSLREKTVFTAK